MPRTDVVFCQESENEVPVLDWLKQLRHSDQRAYATCVAAIERLHEFGYELRRPLADILRDGIHELRIRKGRVKHRILYFFMDGIWRSWRTLLQRKTRCRPRISNALFDEREHSKPTRLGTLIMRR
jgi:phage-related protein